MPTYTAHLEQIFADRQSGKAMNGPNPKPLEGIRLHLVDNSPGGVVFFLPVFDGVARYSGSFSIPIEEAERFFNAGLNFVKTERLKATYLATQSQKNK